MPPRKAPFKHPLGCPQCGFDYGLSKGVGQAAPVEARSPRVKQLLDTNDVPLDAEISSLRATQASREVRMVTIDKEVYELQKAIVANTSKLQQAIQDLKTERELILSRSRDFKVITSPLRRMPSDVLGTIFLAFVTQDRTTPVPPSKQHSSLEVRHDTPWLLLRVCRRWRAFVIGLPAVWASLHIPIACHDLPTGSMDRSKQIDALEKSRRVLGRASLLAVHIRNSGTHPLDVSLHQQGYEESEFRILQALLPHSPRWRTAVIAIAGRKFKLLSPIHGSLEVLTTLVLRGQRWDDLLEDINVFDLAPRLRTLRMYSMNRVERLSTLPWAQIETFQWEDPLATTTIFSHLHPLRRMPNLTECIQECRWPLNDSAPPVVLAKLRRMVIKERSTGPSISLIKKLTLPSLTHLGISNPAAGSDEHLATTIISLVDRSQCRLTSLTLNLSLAGDEIVLAMLRGLPLIAELCILDHGTSLDKIVSALTFLPDHLPKRLIPHLTSLSLTASSVKDHPTFVDMIESRCSQPRHLGSDGGNSAAKLQTLALSNALPWSAPPLRARFEKCCRDGLRFIEGPLKSL